MPFGKIDPSRAAGGECRALPCVKALQQFGTFFHDHEIGTEIGVDNDIRADPLQGGDDLALHIGAGRQTEFFAERNTNRRSELEDGHDLGIVDHLQDLVGLIALPKCAGRADQDALTAGDAAGFLL